MDKMVKNGKIRQWSYGSNNIKSSSNSNHNNTISEAATNSSISNKIKGSIYSSSSATNRINIGKWKKYYEQK